MTWPAPQPADQYTPDPERLCASLRTARERLCVAQTDCRWPSHRADLQAAIDTVDRLGVWYCASWSRYDYPPSEAT